MIRLLLERAWRLRHGNNVTVCVHGHNHAGSVWYDWKVKAGYARDQQMNGMSPDFDAAMNKCIEATQNLTGRSRS